MRGWQRRAVPAARPIGGVDGAGGRGRFGFWRKVWRLAADYYGSEERRSAWAITAATVALTLFQIAVQVRLNLWNRDFFDALDKRDHDRFLSQMTLFVVLAVAGTAAAVLQLYARQTLQVWWRDWLVRHLHRRMLADSAHYRMQFVEGAADNPDQRIGENARWATSIAVDMALGLLHSVLLLVSFVGILWTLSGPLTVSVSGREFEIPGYMVFAALLYAGAATGATWFVGRRMPDINARRNEAEGDHRFALVRLRENSEGVALIRGEADEERGLKRAFGRVTGVMHELNRAERNLVGLSSAYAMITMVFPILVASPRYFAGAITLGVLMQVGSAFGEVTRALNWFMDNYPRLADWTCHVDRVVELEDSLDAAGCPDQRCALQVEEGPGADGEETVSFEGVAVATPAGKPLVRQADAVIRPGERVLIQGESGTGSRRCSAPSPAPGPGAPAASACPTAPAPCSCRSAPTCRSARCATPWPTHAHRRSSRRRRWRPRCSGAAWSSWVRAWTRRSAGTARSRSASSSASPSRACCSNGRAGSSSTRRPPRSTRRTRTP